MRKLAVWLGLLVTPWWLFTVLLFGELQPGYSHLYQAASELGAFGASHPLAMNLLCFFLTGACVALTGWAFADYLRSRQESRAAGWWLVALGVMLAGAAVPADMELYFQSPWTRVHAFFVLLGVVPFLVASWLTDRVLKRLGAASGFLTWFPWLIVPAFLLHGFLSQGGLVQRLTILIVLLWVSALSWHFIKRRSPADPAIQRRPAPAGMPPNRAR